ncbi:MAG: TatD family hydrolase [Treponema sp.]|nr:TatD family hydrolase [Treponema sp.]
MLTDAHCHPYDFTGVQHKTEKKSDNILSAGIGQPGVLAAASACSLEEFTYNEKLAHNTMNNSSLRLLPCFGIHPQLFIMTGNKCGVWSDECGVKNDLIRDSNDLKVKDLLDTLTLLASERRIYAIGECGFDLYNAAFRETEKIQEIVFAEHLETAIKYDLPVVLHVRRAMNKIFSFAKTLSKCKAVVFNSWPGTYEEALSLLSRGINVYFSFGNTVMLNHKQAIRSCALLPAERLLTETDTPYQPRRGENRSFWTDLPLILETIASLRNEAGDNTIAKDLELKIENNFRKVFDK